MWITKQRSIKIKHKEDILHLLLNYPPKIEGYRIYNRGRASGRLSNNITQV